MGQKIDPRGFRLAVTKAKKNGWASLWYAGNNKFAATLQEDIKIRAYITKSFGRRASIGRVLIERPAKNIKVTIYTARPGVLIGKKGEGIDSIKVELQKLTKMPLHLNIEEIRKPELNAQIVADQVAQQIEKRVAFRRAMKRAMQTTIKMGALGVKIMVSGRLNGADIARSEWYREGRVPLHTLRADIEYSTSEANTTFGIIGIKVWIYLGDMNLSKNKFTKRVVDNDEPKKLRKTSKPSVKKVSGANNKSNATNVASKTDKDIAKTTTQGKRKVGTEDVAAE